MLVPRNPITMLAIISLPFALFNILPIMLPIMVERTMLISAVAIKPIVGSRLKSSTSIIATCATSAPIVIEKFIPIPAMIGMISASRNNEFLTNLEYSSPSIKSLLTPDRTKATIDSSVKNIGT